MYIQNKIMAASHISPVNWCRGSRHQWVESWDDLQWWLAASQRDCSYFI